MLGRRKKKKEIERHDKSYVKNPIKVPEIKKISFRILYKNGRERTGILNTSSMDEVIETFLKNQYSYEGFDNKRLVYFNSYEILEFEAEELSNK